MLHSIKGFKDRRKAAAEVLQQLRAVDTQYQRAAAHVVRRNDGLGRLAAEIPGDITDQFFERAQAIVAAHA
jgi:hypothetical protein